MITKEERQNLLLEAHEINYRLRSTFFYRKLIEYHTYDLPLTIVKLIPISKEYSWTKKKRWGISQDAFDQISNLNINPIQIFAHPRLLREHPSLTAYYRNVAALSQKSVGYLSGVNPNRFEKDNPENMTDTDALALSRLFNEHISLIIESALKQFRRKHIQGLLFASTGAQIDGSWRNAIGDESEKVVQKMLIKGAIDLSQLSAFILRDNKGGVEPFSEKNLPGLLDRADEFRGFMLKNKRSVLFSSEPDISLIDQDGTTIAVIEIKGGTDPAGALERYGAAKKSFDVSIKQNPKAKTILVASCITSEVEKRVSLDPLIKRFFNLTALVTIEKERTRFLEYIFRTLLKCSS